MLTRFHSAIVEVQDFDPGVEHYSTLLGRKPAWMSVDPARGTRSAFFSLSNMTLEIRAPGTGSALREGLVGLRLELDDPGADHAAEFAKRGVEIVDRSRASFEPGTDEQSADRPPRAWDRLAIAPRSSRGIDIELVAGASPAAPSVAAAEGIAAEGAAAISALDHVVIFSAAPDSTRAFYGDGLGIRLALDRSFEDRQVRLLFFRIGGVTIEIGSRLGGVVDEDSPDRFGGLAWRVEDVERIRQRLLGEDFDVSEVRKGNKADTRVCTVRSPVHGVPTLLIQPVSG